MSKKKIFKIFLSVLITAYLVYAFIAYLNFDFKKLPEIISKVPYYIFILIFLVNILVNFIRSYRFKILLKQKVQLKNMFRIVNAHQFYNSVLPYRTGELSYIYLLKRDEGITTNESSASLILSRAVDIFALLFCFICCLIFAKSRLQISTGLISGLIICAIAILFIGFFAILNIDFFLNWVSFFFGKTKLIRFKFFKRIADWTDITSIDIKSITTREKLIKTILITIVLTLVINLNTFLLIRYFNIPLNFTEVFIASSATFLTLFLPIQGVANIGTYEGTLLIGLALFHIDHNTSLGAAFSMHIVFFLVFIITFIFIKFLFFINRNNK